MSFHRLEIIGVEESWVLERGYIHCGAFFQMKNVVGSRFERDGESKPKPQEELDRELCTENYETTSGFHC